MVPSIPVLQSLLHFLQDAVLLHACNSTLSFCCMLLSSQTSFRVFRLPRGCLVLLVSYNKLTTSFLLISQLTCHQSRYTGSPIACHFTLKRSNMVYLYESQLWSISSPFMVNWMLPYLSFRPSTALYYQQGTKRLTLSSSRTWSHCRA